jgi:hypothetical protein
MVLSVHDRLTLLQILPSIGDISTLRIFRDLGTELGFSEEEHKALALEQVGDAINWEPTAAKDKDVSLGVAASAALVKVFENLSEQETLTMPQLSLYERMLPPEPSDKE